MKNSLRLIAMSVILFTACKKEETSIIPETPTPPDTSYYINGLTDIQAFTFGGTNTYINIVKTTTDHRKINVSFSGYPPNVEAKASSTSGYPDFTTYLEMDYLFTPAGTYPFTITTQAEGNEPKEYKINIIVDTLEEENCQSLFTGLYSGDDFQLTSNAPFPLPSQSAPFIRRSYNDEKLYFWEMVVHHDSNSTQQNIYKTVSAVTPNANPGTYHVLIDFDCQDGTITIPEQAVMAYGSNFARVDTFMVKGEGRVDVKAKRYTITYTSTPFRTSMAPVQYTMSGKARFPL